MLRAKDLEVSRTLEALAEFREQMVLLVGLSNHQASLGAGAGFHSKCQTTWLSGVAAKVTEGADIGAGATLDQLAALTLGEETPLRSLEVCTEPSFMGAVCEQGLSCVYQNTFSWRSPTTPLPMEHNPRVIFERLFGSGGTPAERLDRMNQDRSILDWLMSEIAALERTLGAPDRVIVDDYLQAIREVERRIQQEERTVGQDPIDIGEAPVGVPNDPDAHVELLFDLQHLAFRADVTRVVSYMIRREQSQVTYPHLGVPEAHHNVSHHQGNAEKIAMAARVNAHHVSLFAGFVRKLAETQDGDGSLLDHSVLLYGAGMGDGDTHDPHELPVLLVGGGCGSLKGGRTLKYPPLTPMMNLGVALLGKVGSEIDQIGDSTGPLAEL